MVPDKTRVIELGERLAEAARPYMERAAPHEQLFSGEDLRNFDRLAAALKGWDDMMTDRFLEAIEREC